MSVDSQSSPAQPDERGDLRQMVTELTETVADLKEENAALRKRVHELEQDDGPSVEFRGGKAIENLWIGGVPIGMSIQKTKDDKDLLNRLVYGTPEPETSRHEADAIIDEHGTVLDTVTSADTSAGGSGATKATRSKMVNIHRKLADFQDGADTSMSANVRRGVRIFRRFIQKLDPDKNETGVENSHGKYRMTGKRARQILARDQDLPSSGGSKTVWRAMGHVCDKAYVPDHECSCSNQDCEHTMFSRSNKDGYTLSVDADVWEEYLEDIASAAGSEVSATTPDDDGKESSEGPGQDATDELDQLMQADVSDESADTVVSRSEESVSGGN